jgi:hypothetical protein
MVRFSVPDAAPTKLPTCSPFGQYSLSIFNDLYLAEKLLWWLNPERTIFGHIPNWEDLREFTGPPANTVISKPTLG